MAKVGEYFGENLIKFELGRRKAEFFNQIGVFGVGVTALQSTSLVFITIPRLSVCVF